MQISYFFTSIECEGIQSYIIELNSWHASTLKSLIHLQSFKVGGRQNTWQVWAADVTHLYTLRQAEFLAANFTDKKLR